MGLETNILPTFSPISFNLSPSTITLMVWAVVIATLVAFFFRMHKNRISVEIYDSVRGGYVARPGRYRKVLDKDTNTECLISMNGGMRLPAFNNEDYQKVNGAAFIGSLRLIKLIRINRHTYTVLKPTEDTDKLGSVTNYNSLTWVHAEANREFEKRIKGNTVFKILAFAAPSVVIIMAVVLMASALYTDNMLLQKLGDEIHNIGVAMGEVCSRWIKP